MSVSTKGLIYLFSGKGASEQLSCLSQEGYELQVFEQVDALISCCAQAEPVALIIDIDFAAQNAVSSTPPVCHFPVIAWSELAGVENKLQATRFGCTSFVLKSDACARLKSIILSIQNQVQQSACRVLMVDDDEFMLDMHAFMLETTGIQVKKILDPLQALSVIEDFDPDLILLDLMMPQCSGLELAQVIRMDERYAYTPIVFLSAETDEKQQQGAMLSGGDDFIVKPVDPERFLNLVQARLKRARYIKDLNRKLKITLYESEQHRITMDHHAIVSVANVLGEITYVNEKFCEVSGYTADELIGQNHRMLKSGMHSDAFYEDMWDTISQGQVWHGTLCNHNKDGGEYWVESTIVPFLGEDGLPYKYVSARTDITQTRKNEERLSRSQKFANIGTWDWNIQTGELYWSERIASLFGYNQSVPETTYENFLNALHPDDKDVVVNAVNDCVQHGKHYDIEHRVIWDDGSEHWLHESGDVIRSNDGSPVHMLGVVRDITARKDAELRLAESEQNNLMMLNSMGEGMFGLDLDANISFINQSACHLLGYQHDALIGESVYKLFPEVNPSTETGERQLIIKTLKTALSYQASNAAFIKKNRATLPVEYYSTPIIVAGNVIGAVVTFKDISERLRYETDLILAKEQAERANKAKSQFLSSMSHELRTPLNAIIGFGQLLEMAPDQPLTYMQKDNVSEILKAGNHLLDLINEILDLAKIEAGQVAMHIEDVLLSEVLEESVALVGPMASKHGITISCWLQGELVDLSALFERTCLVRADKLRLKQVVLNLLSNAIKYNKPNGTVEIECQFIAKQQFSLSIRDSGIGMSPEQQQELFQPFNRLGIEDSGIEGTGMGLVITKRLVEFMGGQLHFESEDGKGTVFKIELQASKAMAENAQHHPEAQDAAAGESNQTEQNKRFNVLYIEDNPANIRLMAQIMAGMGHINLWTVHEPLLGLEIVRENNPDLILLDINLPGMDGFEVLQKLREEQGDAIPVIAVSANAMKSDIERGLDAGFDAYVTKPIQIAELMNKVNQLLNYTAE